MLVFSKLWKIKVKKTKNNFSRKPSVSTFPLRSDSITLNNTRIILNTAEYIVWILYVREISLKWIAVVDIDKENFVIYVNTIGFKLHYKNNSCSNVLKKISNIFLSPKSISARILISILSP